MGALRFPDLYVIGPHKVSTTWLFRVLCEHPDVYSGCQKEISYFSERFAAEGADRDFWIAKRRLNAERVARIAKETPGRFQPQDVAALGAYGACAAADEAVYGGLYAPAPAGQRVIDISPSYFRLPVDGIKEMAGLNPAAPILAILRNPADRMLSWIKHWLRAQYPDSRTLPRPGSADYSVVENGLALCVADEQYDGWLPRWEDTLGSERFGVLWYEDLHAPGFPGLKQVNDLLGLRWDLAFYPSAAQVIDGSPVKWTLPPEVELAVIQRALPVARFLADRHGGRAEGWLADIAERIRAHGAA